MFLGKYSWKIDIFMSIGQINDMAALHVVLVHAMLPSIGDCRIVPDGAINVP